MNFVGLDIETTGLELSKGHRLIQIGIAAHRADVITRDVRPIGDIVYDPEAMMINKFTEKRVLDAPYASWVDIELEDGFKRQEFKHGSLTAVGWNVGSFDLSFVRAELPRTAAFFSHRVVDLTGIAMFLAGGCDDWRQIKNASHEMVGKELGHEMWHDAGYDALAALIQWDHWTQYFASFREMYRRI